MSYLSVSTWSLHRLLGPLRLTGWDAANGRHVMTEQNQPQVHTLLELPQEAAARGYKAIEVCHFHFPSTDDDYLDQLRVAFQAANVSFDTLLLDYGDISSADDVRREADMELVRFWIRVAARCGAKQIRIIGGEAPATDREALGRSAAAMRELSAFADSLEVRVITENFKPLLSTAGNCLALREEAGSRLGLITDFGNYHGPGKYDEIAETARMSFSVHAKAAYDGDGLPDEAEFRRCLESVRPTGFDGAYVLIYDGPGDMWQGLERIKRIVEPYMAD